MENKVSTKVVTGKVRLSYANIWQPRSVNGGEEKFSVCLIIPKSDVETIAKIKAAVEQAKLDGKTRFGGRIPKDLKLPLRDGNAERPEDEAFRDNWFVNAVRRDRPQIVDRNIQPIEDESEVYSGCYGRASIIFYPFNQNGSKGIACGLGHIQKLADGEPLVVRSTAEEDFDVVEEEDEDDAEQHVSDEAGADDDGIDTDEDILS